MCETRSMVTLAGTALAQNSTNGTSTTITILHTNDVHNRIEGATR